MGHLHVRGIILSTLDVSASLGKNREAQRLICPISHTVCDLDLNSGSVLALLTIHGLSVENVALKYEKTWRSEIVSS